MGHPTPAAVLFLSVLCLRAEVLPIRAYTTAEGLAHNHINRILPDSRGFLWICTDEGLSRFDGHRFTNYTTASGLPHIHVNDMLETRAGQYWIATDGGITRFHPEARQNRFVTYAPSGPPDSLHINTVVEDRDGSILLGTSAGLYQLREAMGASPRIEPVEFGAPADVHEGSMVNALSVQGDGTLWLGAQSGLYRRGGDGAWRRFTNKRGLPHDFINSFGRDLTGRLWVCTRGGAGRVAMNAEANGPILDQVLTVRDGLPHEDVRGIWFAKDGRRWVGTLGGLVEWLPESSVVRRFRTFFPKDGLSDVSIYGFAEDSAGNLWMGSRRGGVMRLARAGFRNYGEPDGLSLSGDETILETTEGQVCIANVAHRRRFICCLDGERFIRIAPDLPRQAAISFPNSGHTTIQDHLGQWWMSASTNLYRFPVITRVRDLASVPPKRWLAGQGPGRLFEDSHGNVWIATRNEKRSGLLRWERGAERFQDLSGALPEMAGKQAIESFDEDKQGAVWFGLQPRGGLLRWRDGRMETVAGVPPGPVHTLHFDKGNRLWIALGHSGLARVDHIEEAHPAVLTYGKANGLSSNEVWCLAEDEWGRIYAGTAQGVDRMDPATGTVARYSNADGLVNGDIRAALRDRHGDLWFVSARGVSRMRPDRVANLHPAQARITSIRVQGNPLALSELGEAAVGPIVFPPNRSSIQIDFSAIEYGAPAHLRYQFRLDGADQAWSEPSENTSVNYANLAPGQYRFRVLAVNLDAPASPVPATFLFDVLPPMWRRWWFQALALMALAGAGFAWHRAHLNRQIALERVRSRIAMDLHDDIGASLSRISVFSEVLKGRVNSADSESQRMIADMAETSRMLVESMRDIVWSIDPRRDDLSDVVTRIRAFGSGLLEGKGIRWVLDAPLLAQKLPAEKRRQLYLILKEAVHNVARHSHGQNASLRIRMEGHSLRAEIEDDGGGVVENGNGLGLESMRARTARLGGSFEIASRPEGGTRVVLRIPIKGRNA